MKFHIIVLAAGLLVATATAASTADPSTSVSPSKGATTANPPTPSSDKIKGHIWADLSPKQQDCIRDKWAKEGEAIKDATMKCHEKNGGSACMREIPQIKPCFA